MSDHPINLSAVEAKLGGHSVFAPSASAMWANCSGSLIPNIYAKDNAGEDAAYGTVGHSVGEQWGKAGEKPIHLIGTSVTIKNAGKDFPIVIDESMLEFVGQYIDRVMYLPGDHHWETRVDFSDLTPITRQTGTADHALCRLHTLEVDDLKLGRSKPIYAKDNTQLLLYGYGFFRMWDWLYNFQTITLRIHMPRLDHFDEWTITRAQLLERAAWLKERAYAAWCKDAPRTPGPKQCEWCRVKTDCAAHAVFTERLIDGVFDNLDSPVTAENMTGIAERLDSGLFTMSPVPLGSLTTGQKALLLPYRKMIESWFSDLHTDLEERCLAGEVVPGYKIVAGKSNRVFTSNVEAESVLDFLGLPEVVIHPRGMISPAQSEIELSKLGYKRKELPVLLGSVVRKPIGKASLVEESDKRPALVSVVGNTFENLTEDL